MVIQNPRERILIAVLVFVVLASGLDLYLDLSHGATHAHIAKEALIVTLSTLLVVWILKEQRSQAVELKKLKQELDHADRQQAMMSDYVQGARKQLSEVIARQFQEWKLTTSEQEVGWLLLKGLSLR